MTDQSQAEPRKNVAQTYTALGLAAFYNTIFHDRGIKLPIHLWPVCRALCDERIRNLMVILGPGSGKSLLISVAYPALKLGHFPAHTILGISAGEQLIQGFMAAVMQVIEHSPYYKELFPKTRPDKSQGWSSERGLFVQGRNPGDPDASYFAAGLNSSSLTGKHARLLLLDDLHDKSNSSSSEQCDKVVQIYYNTIIGRADPQGARFILAGRRWNENDIYGHLKQTGDWVVMELPAERPGSKELYFDVFVPEGLECCFTEEAKIAPRFQL